ncbi:Cuticle-degrading protease [Fusarium odoratissimum]|uniref:Cuticle-degrading protease n=1 Tax=Fusarium oxysporum f. sp. cubense (strain race 4) TaxID=2502994 RepID=N1RFK9_FUSC4|nr:Cuticle-degrading protease [Fusarium odoratissimum]
MKLTTALFGLTGLVGLALSQAIIKNSGVDSAAVVPDSYIVMYKPNMKSGSKQKHEHTITSKAKTKGKEGVIENINLGGFQGYIAEIPASELKDVINSDLVAYIEKDTVVNITAAAAFPLGPLTKRAYTSQQGAPWGLARISHAPKPPGFDSSYYYDTTAGAGTNVYIIDTGIRITHKEFSDGRATWGANFISGSPNTDEYGHGTHVAGTIGGKTYGVAKACRMLAVKVLDKTGSGTMAGLIQGLQWAVKNAKARVDIFAPGSSILSSWHLSDSSSRYLSGTSMAAPHVAGLAAYFISKEGIRGSAAVTQRILKAAIPNVVSDPNGSNNRLAYNAGGA